MKDPVGVFGFRRGFSFWKQATPLPQPCNHDLPAHRMAGTNYGGSDLSVFGILAGEGQSMPAWLEVLLNVIAFAGFIGIAKYHKAPGRNLPDR